MDLIRYTHACIRLEHDGGALVIDPGIWSEPEALTRADAVLITHEHADHVDLDRLVRLGATIYVPAEADIEVLDAVKVTSGEEFLAAGFTVRAVGGRHAFIYGGQPDCANLGYIVNGSLYHPGDSLHVPEQPVETLLAPAHGAWMRISEAIEFIKAVRPLRTFAIHDAQLNERGLSSVNAWLAEQTDSGYQYLAPGEAAEVPGGVVRRSSPAGRGSATST